MKTLHIEDVTFLWSKSQVLSRFSFQIEHTQLILIVKLSHGFSGNRTFDQNFAIVTTAATSFSLNFHSARASAASVK